MSSKINPQNVLAKNLDNDENYVVFPKPTLWATSKLFEPKQVHSAISPITFTAQEAGVDSNADLIFFWNRVFFTKQSRTGKSWVVSFLATSEKHSTDSFSTIGRKRFNAYIVWRVGLHHHLLNIAPLFFSWLVWCSIYCFNWLCKLYSHSKWNMFFHFSVSAGSSYTSIENFVSLYKLNLDFMKHNKTEFCHS